MSKRHIDDLRHGLLLNKWEIISEDNGDEFSISAYWIIFNIKSRKRVRIAFDGLDDLSVLPLEQSYACHVEGQVSLSLYFSKNNPKEWKNNLSNFLSNLNEYASGLS